ncbi:methyl-accepting chemotaxis protein [Pleurocapsales cyanobacterium LEGE 06147]|nr:methyl-accepting chemotaxis protein [Pleurocapsales cyanobacterium LEGE 06147]
MLQKLSFRAKTLIFAVALGTLPVIGCGAIVYTFASKNIYKSEVKSEEAIAANVSSKINRFMFERTGDVQTLSNLPILTNPKVKEIVSTQDRQKILDNYIKIYQVYDSIAAFDLNGDLLVQSSGALLSNHKDRVYFQQVIQTGQVVISNPELSKSSGKMVIHLAAPIKEFGTGKTIGVVRSRMPIEVFSNLLKEFDNTGIEWHLVENPSGQFFAAIEANQVGRDAKSDYSVFAQMQSTNKITSEIDVDKLDGVKKLVTYAPLPQMAGMPELDWSVIVAKDTKEAFAVLTQLLWIILLSTGVTALASSGIAFVIADRSIKLIGGVVNAIASSVTEIVTTMEQQERSITQQATSVNETTTTMDELGASTRQAAEQAEASSQGTQQALTLAEDGSKVVHQTVQGMSTLKEQVRAIAEQIMHLSEQTGQIAGISELVGDIANQTNMLALNAAVEAARAGEQGKGFGVVASEIRKLADESKKSAQKINSLVTEIQAAMNSTVMVTDEGTKKTEESIALARGTAETFISVADAINNVFLNSQQISLSSKQQAIGVQQVVAAMNALNLGARETATGINQVKVSTQQLQEAAQQLRAMV